MHCIFLFLIEKLIHVQGEIMPKSKQDFETKKDFFTVNIFLGFFFMSLGATGHHFSVG
jgi:hypothetical protein